MQTARSGLRAENPRRGPSRRAVGGRQAQDRARPREGRVRRAVRSPRGVRVPALRLRRAVRRQRRAPAARGSARRGRARAAGSRRALPVKQRYGYIDWYRGLACVLMFQTHAYDSWTRAADRAGWFWWTSRHLGGFPSRLFLFLAGVSLMLRFEGDRKRQTPVAQARFGAAKRGLEVLALGYLFRISEWIFAGAGFSYASDILRVD